MAIIEYRTDNGIDPRTFIIKLDFNKLDVRFKRNFFHYLIKKDGYAAYNYSSGIGTWETYNINIDQTYHTLYFTLYIPENKIEETESILSQIEINEKTSIRDYLKGLKLIENEFKKIECSYILDQKRGERLFKNFGNENRKESINKFEEVLATFKTLINNEVKAKPVHLNNIQYLLLLRYFKEAYNIQENNIIHVHTIILALTTGLNQDEIRKENKPSLLKIDKSYSHYTSQNVRAILKYIRYRNFEKKRYGKALKPLIQKLEEDLEMLNKAGR